MPLTISDYSDKCIVLRGEETRQIKNNLIQLGGKFNPNLKDGAGWIFTVKKRTEVENLIKNLKIEPKISMDMSDIENRLCKMTYVERMKFVNEILQLAIRLEYKKENKEVEEVVEKEEKKKSD